MTSPTAWHFTGGASGIRLATARAAAAWELEAAGGQALE